MERRPQVLDQAAIVEEGARATWLALALGPMPRQEELLAVEDPAEAVRSCFPHHLAYPLWAAARGTAEVVARMRRILRQLTALGGRAVLASDPDYPAEFQRLARAPAVLFVRGALPTTPLVALVGSRAARLESVREAVELARTLAAAGVGIVSGGALGIDSAAHQGALSGGGSTIAVLGSGLDRLYPERNRELFARTAAQGALVTPFPLGAPPRAAHFPQRNRLIAAWARAVIVVEAGLRSGALHTAGWAMRLGIPVLARPHGPGARRLLQRGAGLITSAQEVLAVLDGAPPRRCTPEPGDADERAALDLLGSPRSIDEVARSLGWREARAAAALIRLEVIGLVTLSGGRFCRVEV